MLYLSVDDYLKRYDEHLAEGDLAQAAEKVHGATKMGIKKHFEKLAADNPSHDIAPIFWQTRIPARVFLLLQNADRNPGNQFDD